MSQSDDNHSLSPVRIDIPPGNPPVCSSAAESDPGLHHRSPVPGQTGLLECQGPRLGPVADPLRHHGDGTRRAHRPGGRTPRSAGWGGTGDGPHGGDALEAAGVSWRSHGWRRPCAGADGVLRVLRHGAAVDIAHATDVEDAGVRRSTPTSRVGSIHGSGSWKRTSTTTEHAQTPRVTMAVGQSERRGARPRQ